MSCVINSTLTVLEHYHKYPTKANLEQKLKISGWQGDEVELDLLMTFLDNINLAFSYTSKIYLVAPYILLKDNSWVAFVPYKSNQKWRMKGGGVDMGIKEFSKYSSDNNFRGLIIYGHKNNFMR